MTGYLGSFLPPIGSHEYGCKRKYAKFPLTVSRRKVGGRFMRSILSYLAVILILATGIYGQVYGGTLDTSGTSESQSLNRYSSGKSLDTVSRGQRPDDLPHTNVDGPAKGLGIDGPSKGLGIDGLSKGLGIDGPGKGLGIDGPMKGTEVMPPAMRGK